MGGREGRTRDILGKIRINTWEEGGRVGLEISWVRYRGRREGGEGRTSG